MDPYAVGLLFAVTSVAAGILTCPYENYVDDVLRDLPTMAGDSCLDPAPVPEFPVSITHEGKTVYGGFRNGMLSGILTSLKRNGLCASIEGAIRCNLTFDGAFLNYYGFVKGGYPFRPNHYCFMGLALKNTTLRTEFLPNKDGPPSLEAFSIDDISFEFTHPIDNKQQALFDRTVKETVRCNIVGFFESQLKEEFRKVVQSKSPSSSCGTC